MVSIGLILLLTVKHKPYFTTTGTILAKLYSNSMMVIFNSRIRIVGARDTSNGWRTHTSTTLNQSRGPIEFAHPSSTHPPDTINMDDMVWAQTEDITHENVSTASCSTSL